MTPLIFYDKILRHIYDEISGANPRRMKRKQSPQESPTQQKLHIIAVKQTPEPVTLISNPNGNRGPTPTNSITGCRE